MSIFTDIRSLKHRPSGGLDIGNDRAITGDSHDGSEWIYLYSFRDLIDLRTDDVVKVTSVLPGSWSQTRSYTVIERYFLIRNGHRALALCRRISQIETATINQSYVTGTDRALSQSLKSRAYPFKTRQSYDDYVQYASDVFTPVIISAKDTLDLYNFVVDDSKCHLEWIDKVALQGWFPASVIKTLDLTPPEHPGWDMEGAFIPEIGAHLADGTCRDLTPIDITGKMSETIMKMVSESVLSDYKVTLDVRHNARMPVSVVEFKYYDPKCGEVGDISELPRETIDDEISLVVGYMNEYIYAMWEVLDSSIRDEVTQVRFYRCLNDVIYVLFHTSTQDKPIGYVVCDFFKYLAVHNGFVDIPLQALQ